MTTQTLTILDGGMGRELHRRGAPFRQPEWSALALTEAPDAVRDTHLDYIRAGAEVITTNSYAVVPFHIGEHWPPPPDAWLAKPSNKVAATFKSPPLCPHCLVLTAQTCLISKQLLCWHSR